MSAKRALARLTKVTSDRWDVQLNQQETNLRFNFTAGCFQLFQHVCINTTFVNWKTCKAQNIFSPYDSWRKLIFPSIPHGNAGQGLQHPLLTCFAFQTAYLKALNTATRQEGKSRKIATIMEDIVVISNTWAHRWFVHLCCSFWKVIYIKATGLTDWKGTKGVFFFFGKLQNLLDVLLCLIIIL